MIEHIEYVGIKSADIDFATLGNMAIKSQAYAKALYYKEYEFRTNPADSTKDLVDINQALDQPDAAKGIIMKTNDLSFDSMGENPRVRFFVSLSQWENALEKYEAQMKNAAGKDDGLKQYDTATVGKLQCLISLGRYVEVNDMLNNEWNVLGEKLNMHRHIFRTIQLQWRNRISNAKYC